MPAIDSLKRKRTPAEEALAGSPAAFDSQGLQMPPEVLALIQSLMMPPVTQGLGKFAQQVPGQVGKLSDAGAIFPEGFNMPIPKERALAQELGSILPESQQHFIRNRALSDWHAQNLDWPRVLQDKWAMLQHAGGS